MHYENEDLAAKTWARVADPITKVGYMDGAADGQKATFQSSFDTGYKLGFNIGFKLGMKEAVISTQSQAEPPLNDLNDPRRINCQMCLDSNIAQDNIESLVNKQKNNNNQYM